MMRNDSRSYGHFKKLAKKDGVNANTDKEVEQYTIDYFKQFEGGLNTKSEWRPRFESEKGDDEKARANMVKWYEDLKSGDSQRFLKAAAHIDKEKLARFIPNMPDYARIGNVKYYNDGTMKLVVIDKHGNTVSEPVLNVNDVPEEMWKNTYTEQYKDTKRNYGTTETGAKATTAQQQPSNPQTPAFAPGFLNKGK